MRRLIATALELGWSLWAYEANIEPGKSQTELLSLEFTNWREREQAKNLCQIAATAPEDPLLVWCGNGHAFREGRGGWVGILRERAPQPLDGWPGADAVVVSTENKLM